MKFQPVAIALKYLLLIVAAFTTLMALLVGVMMFTLVGLSAEAGVWIFARVSVCVFIVTMGAFTWLHFRSMIRGSRDLILLVGAMLLMVVGAFGVAWSIHMGDVTGDYEYWVMMIDMALSVQGALTILCLWNGRPAIPSPPE